MNIVICSEIIRNGLDSRSLANIEENVRICFRFEKKMGEIYKELNRKFIEEIYDRQTKLSNALIFEANLRLMKHPYDLVGCRRLKLFEESLQNYLKVGDHMPQEMTRIDNIKQEIFKYLNPSEHVLEIFKALKVITVVALVALIVNINDYIQDLRVIMTFWHIGYNGYLLQQRNSTNYSLGDGYLLQQSNSTNYSLGALGDLLLKFYPPAMFMTVVMMFSLIITIVHIPSLWYRYRVSMQMENPNTESEMEEICPKDVYNQYNLSISESQNEAIWQMMVQWGQYFCFAWFVTWRLQVLEKDDDPCELLEVQELLDFWKLFLSLLSSVCSLTYGQYVTHAITYKYRTSGKQKVLYLACSVMNTLCNMLILLTWQTVAKDYAVGFESSTHSFDFFDLTDKGRIIISVMLLTPLLYGYMILPSTTKEYMTFSMKTPRFLNRFKNHCLVYSFYLGLAGYFYTWVFTSLDPTFPERAAIMTKNDSFRGKIFIKIILSLKSMHF